jgi:cytochrome c553
MKRWICLLIVFYAWHPLADEKQKTCVACHGAGGVSNNSLWPNLAGQKEEYIVKQLHAFRDGSRVDPLMSPISQMLSDDDIKELAAYYSHLKAAQ